MKTIFIKLFLTLVLVTAVANAQAPTVQASLPTQVTSDTDSAAVLTARERLKTIYGVADEQIVVKLVESQGKWVSDLRWTKCPVCRGMSVQFGAENAPHQGDAQKCSTTKPTLR